MTGRARRTGAAALLGLALLVGCSNSDGQANRNQSPSPSVSAPSASSPSATTAPSSPTPTPTPTPSSTALPTVTVAGTIADDLPLPWGIAFLPDGSALVTERDTGNVLKVPASGNVTTVGTVPGVNSQKNSGGESGLLGIAVHPDYPRQPWVYVYYSTSSDNRVVRMRYENNSLGTPEVLVKGIRMSLHHNGGGLAFGPDGLLYASTGDAQHPDSAQDRASLNGKILRMTDTGKAPPDNPYEGSLVWSYGHRNVEGLAFDSTGQLWASEFGSSRWDELNRIRRGGNYGWPMVEGRSSQAGLIDPFVEWPTSDASPSGLAIVGSSAYLGALRGERLLQVSLATQKFRNLFTGDYGRIRAVAAAPDGTLWMTTSNKDGRGDPAAHDDRILRLRLRD